MTSAILDAAQFGKTAGMAAEIIRCRLINQQLGTNIPPWEMEHYPEEWLAAVEMMSTDLPRAREWAEATQQSLAKLREQRKQRWQ